jgi:hypothetical protein
MSQGFKAVFSRVVRLLDQEAAAGWALDAQVAITTWDASDRQSTFDDPSAIDQLKFEQKRSDIVDIKHHKTAPEQSLPTTRSFNRFSLRPPPM